MNVIGMETSQNHSQVLAMSDFSMERVCDDTRTPASIGRMTLSNAWGVRTALLVLYVPVKILSAILEMTHQLDSWASRVVTQTAEESLRNNVRLAEPRTTRGQVVQFLSNVQ
jgi:hypothetical protein